MSATAILEEAYGRIPDAVRRAVTGLDANQLAFRPSSPGNAEGNSSGRNAAAGNSIAWLVWHLARVQDNHIADAAALPELWNDGGWAVRFDLDLDASDTGYGHSSAQVSKVRPASPELLVDYYDAVHARTLDFVTGLGEADLSRIVDTSWNPPVTLQVRLVSVIEDCMQHVGQAAYVRGLLTQDGERD
ncbi:mycothiol transferase [Arthrobacter flavus]|uniref:DUF664 domain-containing protein n=1 Tax=Arthrobacter flavus TaxID=95172 RepID=A0ABW4Q527_9MICC